MIRLYRFLIRHGIAHGRATTRARTALIERYALIELN